MCSGFAPCDEEPAVVISQSMPPLKALDAFAKPHIDEATKTKCGGILTVIALPLLMTGFSAWWWYDFYIFSETWRATTTESRLYANSIKDLKLECSAARRMLLSTASGRCRDLRQGYVRDACREH